MLESKSPLQALSGSLSRFSAGDQIVESVTSHGEIIYQNVGTILKIELDTAGGRIKIQCSQSAARLRRPGEGWGAWRRGEEFDLDKIVALIDVADRKMDFKKLVLTSNASPFSAERRSWTFLPADDPAVIRIL